MASSAINEMVTDLYPIIRVYKDRTVERLIGSPHVPPSSEEHPAGVSSKDLKISPEVSARIYLPNVRDSSTEKLPILVYFHGGGFCVESAFSFYFHRYINILASEAKALILSVEYRLAPEHPLPAAYDDGWTALQWVASHVLDNSDFDRESWLINHGNFDKLYIGGDTTGANIAHNIAMRAGSESLSGDLKILGAFLSEPFFLGSDFDETERKWKVINGLWKLAYPSAAGGVDNPMVNPLADDAPSLSWLGCSRLLVTLPGKEIMSQRGIRYVEAVNRSGWKGEVEMIEIEGEDHGFHILNPDTENAKILTKHLASFLS